MQHRDQILSRLAWLQAELVALQKLIEAEPTPAPVSSQAAEPVVTPEPAPAPAATPAPEPEAAPEPEPKKKVRWRYVPGTWYRIVGDNPFRNGNNYNLFEYLKTQYGGKPFSREQLGEAIGVLARNGRIDTVQGEDTFVMVFLRTAGAAKGRIEMSDAPSGGKVQPKHDPADALPPEPGEVKWKLTGSPSFHKGSINDTIWKAMEGRAFSRAELATEIGGMLEAGAISSSRSGDIIARDFVGLVADRGLAEKA